MLVSPPPHTHTHTNTHIPLFCIEVDLLTPTNISGVITQGAKDFGREQFVSSYKLTYSQDGRDWTTFQDEERHNDKVEDNTRWWKV